MNFPGEVFEGLPPHIDPDADYDLDEVYRLIDLTTSAPGQNLARLVEALEGMSSKGDGWSDAFGFAALRLNKRLYPGSPEEAAHWLERARSLSEPCATQRSAMNWGMAMYRLVRRAEKKDPSRELDVAKQMMVQAAKWREPSLVINTLDIAKGAIWALVDVGRSEEAFALGQEALTLPFTESDLVQRWHLLGLHRELGTIERKRNNLDAAVEWYAKTRALWRPKLKDAQGDLAWLLAEVIHVARLQQKPEVVLQHAEDFERELGTSKDKVVKEEAEFVRTERALALVQLGRLAEVETALEQLPARPVMMATRSLAVRVRVLLAQAKGEPEVARTLAQKALKTFAGEEKQCHDDLDFFHAVLRG